jgi:tetratricopeptide (TPR) repeat protein
MDTVTYPDPRVHRFIEQSFVPIHVELPRGGPVVEKYRAYWTPTFVFLDEQGREADRVMGYLPPDEFLAALGLGLGRVHMAAERHREAAEAFGRVVDEGERTTFAPEALYWHSVARYKADHKAEELIGGWKRLLERWPDSRWARSVEFVRDF